VARILRVPFHAHWKDQTNPFIVKCVFISDSAYSEEEMRRHFPAKPEAEAQLTQSTHLRTELRFQKDSGLWERVWTMNCEDALSRSSGDKKNILVNGKSTSCWIDSSGRIGSTSGGGPTIFNWLKWFGNDNKRSYELLKNHFPEVINERV
jgi:hypothetical protein